MKSSTLTNFDLIAACPEVVGAVVTDQQGALLEASGDLDSESVGAIFAVSADAFARGGDAAGLGGLNRIVLTGPRRGCFITTRNGEVFGVFVEAGQATALFEKKLDELLQRKR